MITCKKCEFETNTSMRHSLIKNCCPCCGSALLGDLHMRRLEILKRKILEQEFSQGLNNNLVFDISLFMLTEFFSFNTEESEGEEASDELEPLEEEGADLSEEEDYESIRNEVRGEVLSKMEEELEDADVDLKVARLKRIAKEKPVRSSGPSVRRISD